MLLNELLATVPVLQQSVSVGLSSMKAKQTEQEKKEFASGRFVFSNASTSTLTQERKKKKKKSITGNVEGLSLSFATLP